MDPGSGVSSSPYPLPFGSIGSNNLFLYKCTEECPRRIALRVLSTPCACVGMLLTLVWARFAPVYSNSRDARRAAYDPAGTGARTVFRGFVETETHQLQLDRRQNKLLIPNENEGSSR